jgi:sulfite reductase (ferredoxin)
MELVEAERLAIKNKSFEINTERFEVNEEVQVKTETVSDVQKFEIWKTTNTFEQKQQGKFGVYIRVPLGNISSVVSRSIIEKLNGFVGDDIRVTINQGLFLRNVPAANLAYVFNVLESEGLAAFGANSVANITACPGTDTCNLAISDSVSITYELEKVIDQEFPDLVKNNDFKIKISGCMNSCGQHGMANIGFHGSSLKDVNKNVLPALQVLLGGGASGDGFGRAAEKVIKVPSKRGPQVLRYIFSDYQENGLEGEYFNNYFDRKGKNYFYELLKPLASLDALVQSDFIDWGQEVAFETAIGVGECAAVMVDLVAILFVEADEKLADAKGAFESEKWADAIYLAYSAQVNAAKAMLLDIDVNCSTQMKVISEFTKNFEEGFQESILRINKENPTKEFAVDYIRDAVTFCSETKKKREENLKSQVTA